LRYDAASSNSNVKVTHSGDLISPYIHFYLEGCQSRIERLYNRIEINNIMTIILKTRSSTYDFSKNNEYKNLVNTINTMKSCRQNNHLSGIYQQILDYKDYASSDAAYR